MTARRPPPAKPSSGAFERLAATVTAHGHPFDTADTAPRVWKAAAAELELSPEFTALYTPGPAARTTIPWIVEDLMVFSLGELAGAQAGYRWGGPQGVETRQEDWPANWVVIASASADPFIADTSKAGCPVLFARHGDGAWSPVEVASSMQDFLECLAVFEEVLLGRFDQEIWDGDDGLLRDFLEAVEQGLASVLTGPQAAAFVALLE